MGAEVAVIDWDGKLGSTRVDWGRVQDYSNESWGASLHHTDNGISGRSGGGVYWNGTHIGNTYGRVTNNNTGDTITNLTALNVSFSVSP